MTEEEKKAREEFEDRFLLANVLALVSEYLKEKREAEKEEATAGKKSAKEAQS